VTFQYKFLRPLPAVKNLAYVTFIKKFCWNFERCICIISGSHCLKPHSSCILELVPKLFSNIDNSYIWFQWYTVGLQAWSLMHHVFKCKEYVWLSLILSKDTIRAIGQGGGQWTCWRNLVKSKRIITNYAYFCAATTLTLKITAKFLKKHSEFIGARIAALNLF